MKCKWCEEKEARSYFHNILVCGKCLGVLKRTFRKYEGILPILEKFKRLKGGYDLW